MLLTGLAVAAIAAAGILANFVLLGYANPRHDPIGKLTPRAEITQPASPSPSQSTDGDHTETDVEEPDD
jgi:hypothetical protein